MLTCLVLFFVQLLCLKILERNMLNTLNERDELDTQLPDTYPKDALRKGVLTRIGP